MKNLIQKIANSFGYSINKKNNNIATPVVKKQAKPGSNEDAKPSLLKNFYNILLEMDYTPDYIIDIGANKGTWTREVLKFFPNAQVTMIEPQLNLVKYFEDMLNSKVNHYSVGVGNKESILKFTIHDRDDSCSFAYSEEQAKARGFRQIDVPVKTLNQIIKENDLPQPDIIKIDAEGLDLEVLEGASDFFGKTEVFMVEAAVRNDFYKNSFFKNNKRNGQVWLSLV